MQYTNAIYENAIYQSRLTNLNCFSQPSGSTLSNERVGVDQPDYEKKIKQKASTALGIVYENKIPMHRER